MKNKNIFWGIFFIVLALLFFGNQFGWFGFLGAYNIWYILVCLFFGSIIVKSLLSLNFYGIILPAAMLLVMFRGPLGLYQINSWVLLLSGLFLAIGLDLLFGKKHREAQWQKRFSGYAPEYGSTKGRATTESHNDNHVNGNVNFGSNSIYLHSPALEYAHFSASFGTLKVFFDQCTPQEDGAEIYVDISFGSIEFYVPRHWNIIDKTSVTLGSVDNVINMHVDGAPKLILVGNINFGSLDMIYT